MSTSVEWDNSEKTLLRFVYQGTWTWAEFHQSVAEGRRMAESVSHKVDHIYDVTNSGAMPGGALGEFRNLRSESPTNLGRRVIVGANTFILVISRVLLKLYPNLKENFLIAETLDEARHLLNDSIRVE